MQQAEITTCVEQAQQGDAAAFARLVEAHYDMMYRVAYKWCGNPQDAEDVAQEVCIKLGQSIRNFRGDASFSSWLYRITLNCVRDMQRRRGRRHETDDGEVAIENHTDGAASPEQQAMQRQLWEQVKELPDRQRDAVLLVYSEELSHAEAAAIMECSESTVSWHIHEAKKQLKASVE